MKLIIKMLAFREQKQLLNCARVCKTCEQARKNVTNCCEGNSFLSKVHTLYDPNLFPIVQFVSQTCQSERLSQIYKCYHLLQNRCTKNENMAM